MSRGGVDLAVDSSGEWADALKALKPGGTLSVFGRIRARRGNRERARGLLRPVLRSTARRWAARREFQALLDHVEGADWKPIVDSVLPLERISDAFARLDSGDRFGNVVIDTE